MGKTAVLHSLIGHEFSTTKAPTVGVDYCKKILKTRDGKLVKTQIWDTAGQEKYRSLCGLHIRDADCLAILLDATLPQELNLQALQRWTAYIENKASEYIQIYVLLNKKDLVANDKSQNSDAIFRFCQDKNIQVYLVSAKSKSGLMDAFISMAEDVLAARALQERLKSERLLSSTLYHKHPHQSHKKKPSIWHLFLGSNRPFCGGGGVLPN